jgi:twitching motility protein PilJ
MKIIGVLKNFGEKIFRINDLKLTTKLSALMFGLLIGYIAIGYAYYLVFQTGQQQTTSEALITSFDKGVREVELNLQSAKLYENEFYTKKFPVLLGKFDTQIISASQNVKGLIKLIENEGDLGEITTKLGEYFEEYRNKFITAAEAMLEIGLDETQGLHFKARNASHDLEKLLNDINNDTLMISLLQMRRHEKDYFSRTADKYLDKFNKETVNFKKILNKSKVSTNNLTEIKLVLNDYVTSFNLIHDEIVKLKSSKISISDTTSKIEPLFNQLINKSHDIVTGARAEVQAKNEKITTFFISTLVLTLILFTISLSLISRSIINAMRKLQSTVVKVNDGDMDARSNLNRNDELGELGHAFDKLLDERLRALSESEKQTDILNESVISLIRAVSNLAQNKDLAMKIPVSEDITGAIGDSLNLLSREISNTLQAVRDTSSQVASVSNDVKKQSDHVIDVANMERHEVEETALLLHQSVESMNKIASSAQEANEKASSTIENTQKALETVMLSVDGINSIRSTIGETEKRIKRLGERSQEITGIVNLINSIAERTHILALNASMHAASAGEAGRGFAVVANEVQRLAENAREATSEISTLVNNIRVETTDTVTTMNTAISQVAEGTRLAEQASMSMKLTQQVTNDLVYSVKEIADRSASQAHASGQLLERARQIQSSTEQTGRELAAQTENTDRLVRYSADLVSSVGVFKLQGDIVSKLSEPKDNAEFRPLKEAI